MFNRGQNVVLWQNLFRFSVPDREIHKMFAYFTKSSHDDSSNVSGVPEMFDRGPNIVLWQNLSHFAVFRSRTSQNVRVLYKKFTSNFIVVLTNRTPYKNFIPRLNNRRHSHANV